MREHIRWKEIKTKLQKMEEREKSKFEFMGANESKIYFIEYSYDDIFFQSVDINDGTIEMFDTRTNNWRYESKFEKEKVLV